MTDGAWGERLLVVGTGLVGTSVALAARATGADVMLEDTDKGRLQLAVQAGAGRAAAEARDVDMVVIAVPPRATGPVAVRWLELTSDAIVTHVCSVQSLPQRDVEMAGADLVRFVGGHPIAGRETSGPAYASADLFHERPWAVCPTAKSGPAAVERVTALARDCGALPVVLDAATHDALLARLSHVPQLVSSALAASITGLDHTRAALAGTGLRDTTRLADSDPGLWTEIVTANATAVADGLRDVAGPLLDLAAALESGADPEAVARELLKEGRRGRSLLPGKHGGAPVALKAITVFIPDEPGALARLFGDIAAESVNVEDMRVEHATGRPLGIAEILVLPSAQDRLVGALRDRGWTVTS
jgi:prephenate dehydrogenase